MKATDSQRVKHLISWLISEGYATSQGELGQKLGVNDKTRVSQLVNGHVSNVDFINKLIQLDGRINAEWVYGTGEMLKSGNTSEETENNLTIVPLLPISAQGGSLNDFIVSVQNAECERITSPIAGVDFAIPIAGDSMSPEYPSGSQVLVKRINERAFIEWGKAYVLDTCNGSVIKILMPGDSERIVKCVSINTDYPSFNVNLDDVYGVYRVLMAMAIK